MVDTFQLEAIVEAAQQAAAAGDYAEADRLLGQAASQQEALYGPLHPELANTLNNRGVVCERAGRPDEAERCYRRAHEIARSALGPDDPLTVTSRQNLQDFCAARGIDVTPRVEAPAPPSAPAPPDSPPRTTGFPSVALVVVLVGVVALGAYVAYGPWFGESGATDSAPQAPADEPATAPPAPPPPQVSAPAPAVAEPAPAPTGPPATSATPPRPRPSAASVSVAEAQLCVSLSTSTWRCTPASATVSPGVLFYFTRIKAPRETSVQHRWYFEGQLLRSITLSIGGNPGAGFRTYSRNTVGRTGNWRVELRDSAGTVLREERFTVSATGDRLPSRSR